MSDETSEIEEEEPKKKGKLGLIIGLVLALVGGGGGFFAVYSGMILAPEAPEAMPEKHQMTLPEVSFVPLEPMIVTVGEGASRQLQFEAQLEVDPTTESDVTFLMPRIIDVLNGYLRAVELAHLEDPAALIRLRAQMLRRIQLVTGDGRVRDLLITQFVLS